MHTMSSELIDSKTGLLAQISPLTFKDADGNLFGRSETVNLEIATFRPLSQSERQKHLPRLEPESLLFFIGETRYLDRDFCGELMLQLGRRTARIVKRYVRGLSEIAAEEILMKVDIQVVELALAEKPSRKSEFLQVSFYGAVKLLTLDAVKSYRRSLLGGKRGWIPAADETGTDGKVFRRTIELAPDSGPGAEEILLSLENDNFRHDLLRLACRAVADRRHLEAVILHFGHGWPILSKDQRKNDLVSHFQATEDQVKGWLRRAMKLMREALKNGGEQ
jgi:hypothetical protein